MTTLADALDKLAEAIAQTALEIRGVEASQDAPEALPPMDTDYDTSWTETDDSEPPKVSGSAAVCPAHGTEYRDGKFGPYCASLGTDPKWTNARGYCQITPKNAAAYLRQKAAR